MYILDANFFYKFLEKEKSEEKKERAEAATDDTKKLLTLILKLELLRVIGGILYLN